MTATAPATTPTTARDAAIAGGCTFRWSDDWEVGNHGAEYGEAYAQGEPDTCENADLFGPDGTTLLASLGCIDDADEGYRAEIENDLAREAGFLPDQAVVPFTVPAVHVTLYGDAATDAARARRSAQACFNGRDAALSDIHTTPTGRRYTFLQQTEEHPPCQSCGEPFPPHTSPDRITCPGCRAREAATATTPKGTDQ